MFQVDYYQKDDGSFPVEEFIRSLDRKKFNWPKREESVSWKEKGSVSMPRSFTDTLKEDLRDPEFRKE